MANFELNVKINGIEQSVSSIGDLEKALVDTKKQLAGVEVGTREFKFLENQAKNLDKVMVAVSDDAKVLNNSLKGVGTTAKDLNQAFTQTAASAAELGTGNKVKGLNEDIKVAAGSSQSLRAELRKITQELQGLEPGSARFQELSLRAGGLRDTIADTSGVISSLAGTGVERLGKALGTTAQIGVAGFQGIAAAQALFGSENEELNKTLVKLTALLNLSQAITTFGGLGDKITELKAGFSSLFPAAAASATAITATAVAEEGEAIASTEAAVATTGFAVALNALPLVAIVTALGLVVAGLISYASAEGEAEKATEKRKKEAEQAKKVQEAQNEAIKKSSEQFAGQISGFISLTAQIKNSLPGSKERLELIKQSNDTYGTTIKNLKDERFFQDQVTKSVADYIAFSRQKFKLAQNEKAIEAEFAKQEVAITKLSSSLGILNQSQKNYITNFARQVESGEAVVGNLDILKAGFTQQGKQFQLLQNDVFDYLGAINLSNSSIDKLSGSITTLKKELNDESNALFLAAGATETNTSATDKATEANNNYNETIKGLIDFTQKTNAAEEDLEKERLARTKDRRDDIEFDKKLRLAELQKEYDAQKKAIDDNIADEQKAAIAKTNLTALFTTREQAIIQSSSNKIDAINKESADNQKKFIEELILAQKVLVTETTFGNNNVADQKDLLLIREKQLKLEGLEIELESIKLGFGERKKIEDDKIKLIKETADLQLKVANQTAKDEGALQISETIKYYQNKTNLETGTNQFIIEQEKDSSGKVLKIRVTSNEKYLEEVGIQGKIAQDDAVIQAGLVEEVINQQRINITEETTKKIENIETDANNKRKAEAIKTDQEIADERIKITETVIFFAQQALTLATELEAGRRADEESALSKQNEDFVKSQQTKADAIEAAYQQDILRNNYTEDQKKKRREKADKDIKDLQKGTNDFVDKNNTALAKKQFARNKAIQISNAIINGAQAALAGIAQFGPPPSPAGIAAIAAAGIITVAQIATISKQKFDGGSTGAPLQVTVPEASSTTPAGTGLNQLGGGFTTFSEGATGTPGGGGGSAQVPFEGQSQRVYVVESDITEAQMRVRVLEDNSTFG